MDFDEDKAFVVKAESHKEARQITAKAASGYEKAYWIDPKQSTCKRVKLNNIKGVIMKSTLNG